MITYPAGAFKAANRAGAKSTQGALAKLTTNLKDIILFYA